MNNSLKTGIVMIIFLLIMFGVAAALNSAQIQAVEGNAQAQIQAGKLIRCESAEACGVLVGMDGNHWMHVPLGVYPVVSTPRNPLDKRYWTMQHIPVAFTPGCWQLDFELALNGAQSPITYRVANWQCKEMK